MPLLHPKIGASCHGPQTIRNVGGIRAGISAWEPVMLWPGARGSVRALVKEDRAREVLSEPP